MKVRLFSEEGRSFIADLVIPPFISPPAVLYWGVRTFVLMPNAGLDEEGRTRYNEVFGYFIR